MKLIDADALMKEHIPNRGEPEESESKSWNFYYGFACALHAVGDVIREMPPYEPDNASAGQAEVVRCKDCKYWYAEIGASTGWLPCNEIATDRNWYCASGKRR